MFYLDGGIVDVPNENAKPSMETGILRNLTNIWTTNWIQRSIEEDGE
jgi:DNA helicase INO80